MVLEGFTIAQRCVWSEMTRLTRKERFFAHVDGGRMGTTFSGYDRSLTTDNTSTHTLIYFPFH